MKSAWCEGWRSETILASAMHAVSLARVESCVDLCTYRHRAMFTATEGLIYLPVVPTS